MIRFMWLTFGLPGVPHALKSLPYFEKLQENYKDQNVELLLVSLDFPRQYTKPNWFHFLRKSK